MGEEREDDTLWWWGPENLTPTFDIQQIAQISEPVERMRRSHEALRILDNTIRPVLQEIRNQALMESYSTFDWTLPQYAEWLGVSRARVSQYLQQHRIKKAK